MYSNSKCVLGPNILIPKVFKFPMYSNSMCSRSKCILIPNVFKFPMYSNSKCVPGPNAWRFQDQDRNGDGSSEERTPV